MILGAEPITRLRYPTPTMIGHRLVQGTPTETRPLCSVQPLEGSELEQLPEGDRKRTSWKLYTEDPDGFQVADLIAGTPADEVVIDGVVYEIQISQQWRALQKHHKAIAVAKQEGS